MRRLALVRPHGVGGAVVAGAYQVLPRPYPVEVFASTSDAWSWLAEAGARDWPDAALLTRLYEEASGTPQLVGSLRAFLDGNLSGTELSHAARALGVSARTLQRKLAEAGTTFQAELSDARVRAAKRLLLDGDQSLTAIAYEVGCASLQHFSALFRKRAGESPSAYRKRARRTD